MEPRDTRVRVQIAENVARTRVHQEFFNPNAHPAEADFIFALPPGSQVTDFVLWVDGKPRRAEVLERDKARLVYEEIVRRLRDPALLEWLDWNLFRVAVFPVPARGTQTVEIEYGQVLAPEQGVYRYVFPTTGPPPQQRARFQRRSEEEERCEVTFTVEISGERTLGNIYSPTHELVEQEHHERSWKGKVVARHEDDWRKDFQLFYDYRDKEVAATLVTSKRGDEAGYFCLVLAPEWRRPRETSATIDLVFVVDTSGSMSDDGKLEQAQRAISYCLRQLGERDRFAILRFSTEVEKYRDQLVQARPAEVARTVDWVKSLRAAGGTNISEALATALELADQGSKSTSEPRSRCMIIFVTDGLPTVGETSVERITKQVQDRLARMSNVRIFSFGVGHDVNTRLLDAIANTSRGASEYVAPEQDLEVPIARLFDKAARPAFEISHLRIEGVEVFDLYPKELPDLFYGSTLLVFGRYKGSGTARIALEGRMGGQPAEFVFEKMFPPRAPANEFIEQLWATRKVAFLADALRETPDSKEIRDEIVALAKRYRIPTPLTSLLVVEDTPRLVADGAQPPSVPHRRGGRQDIGSVGRGQPLAPSGQRAAPNALLAQTGAEAVSAAKTLREMKNAATVRAESPNSAHEMWLEGRRFLQHSGVWMEEGTEQAGEVIRIKNYSEAYFALLQHEPAVRRILGTLGERVRLTLRGRVVEFGNDGAEELPEPLRL